MSQKLKKFLVESAKDPVRWALLEEDPDAALASAGISKSDQAALRSRNVERMRKAIGAGAKAILVIIIPFAKK